MVPDACSYQFRGKARAAFRRADGVTLPNLLTGRVFNTLFRGGFSDGLRDRSRKLVEDVKDFMQKRLGTLCDRVCAGYPVLLNELKTNLMDEFIDGKEAATKSLVNGAIRAEIGWVFTQDKSYEDTMQSVNSMVDAVRKSDAEYRATSSSSIRQSSRYAEAVGCVPAALIASIANCAATSDEECRLQVSVFATRGWMGKGFI